ncbi:MAG: carboxypeptidase regulatory-like domain-containing protein [Rubinisphaera brasiliensis]|uniref:carboxypeptidase regulatory-like domain-containing protein n=1 Tax=Rubinisphaera brasiliensis TaxID=119 RepID=UPI00391DAD48
MRVSIAAVLTAFSLFLAGCGGGGDTPDLGKVSGKVVIDGNPAENVQVTFTPTAGGRQSIGETGADGGYQLVYSSDDMGAIIGDHNVTISPIIELDPESNDTMNSGSSVPKEYLDVTKTVTVEAGSNEIDLTYP